MNKEKFFDTLGECDILTIILYCNEEIPAKFNLNVVSVEDYDDEIIVRGDGTSFVSLQGEPRIIEDLGDTEFIFKNGNCEVGVVF